MKKTRVVVLTTHNMEEADYLGDNIMILHNGRGAMISIYIGNFSGNI
jgi:ABC-type multidrug transport system ATPase subunit